MTIQLESAVTEPKAPLGDEFLVISAVDANLDLDEPDEQIVVVKRRDDPSDRVRVLVTDFDTLRNAYRVTWEGETLATNVRTFAVYTADVVGDQRLEIVAFGTDNDGNQTLNVFRRDPNPTTLLGLEFRDIFSQASDASIEINEIQRSEAYRTLQSDGASYPIDVYRRNLETDNALDLVRTTWTWRARNERYIAGRQDAIPAVQVQEEQLRALYDGEAELLEAFLEGPWFRAIGDNIGAVVELAAFDLEDREVVLYRGETQERYEWLNSYKTLYAGGPGLWINLRNDILPTVRRQVSITVTGLGSIALTVDGAEYWNGSYQRMTPGLQASVVRSYGVRTPNFELDGVYRDENGVEILFDAPRFRMRADGLDWSGGYNLIEIGEPILELKVVSSAGTRPAEARGSTDGTFTLTYGVRYSVQESDGRTIRQLEMRPVRLRVDGIREQGGAAYLLEQVEEATRDQG